MNGNRFKGFQGVGREWFIFTLVCAALALALGLSLRPWLSARPGVAGNQAQSHPVGLAQTPASSASSASAEVNVAAGQLLQTVNGVEVSAANFRLEGNQVKADVCFDRPDDSDWIIRKASLQFGKEGVNYFGFNPIEVRDLAVNGQQRVITFEAGRKDVHFEQAADGQKGRRCDTLHFEVPPDADLSNFTIAIHAIIANPREGEFCTTYLDKLQKVHDARNTGIRLQCTEEAGITNATIVAKPASMSQEEAENIAFSKELLIEAVGIRGPWTFTGSLSR
jgi:hypothetical protein